MEKFGISEKLALELGLKEVTVEGVPLYEIKDPNTLFIHFKTRRFTIQQVLKECLVDIKYISISLSGVDFCASDDEIDRYFTKYSLNSSGISL